MMATDGQHAYTFTMVGNGELWLVVHSTVLSDGVYVVDKYG